MRFAPWVRSQRGEQHLSARAFCMGIGVCVATCSPRTGSRQTSNSQSLATFPDAHTIGCASDPRADTYAPGLHKRGTAGLLQFVLLMAGPTPPSLDYNFWKMEVLDASGRRLSDVAIA